MPDTERDGQLLKQLVYALKSRDERARHPVKSDLSDADPIKASEAVVVGTALLCAIVGGAEMATVTQIPSSNEYLKVAARMGSALFGAVFSAGGGAFLGWSALVLHDALFTQDTRPINKINNPRT